MEQQAQRSQEFQAVAPEQGQASLQPEASPCLWGGAGKAGPPAGVETVQVLPVSQSSPLAFLRFARRWGPPAVFHQGTSFPRW